MRELLSHSYLKDPVAASAVAAAAVAAAAAVTTVANFAGRLYAMYENLALFTIPFYFDSL